jgi:hypothetical protein
VRWLGEGSSRQVCQGSGYRIHGYMTAAMMHAGKDTKENANLVVMWARLCHAIGWPCACGGRHANMFAHNLPLMSTRRTVP